MSRFVAVVASVRSGTTVVRRKLAEHPDIFDIRETFNKRNKFSYLQFVQDRQCSPVAFLEYLGWLNETITAPTIIMDFKYGYLEPKPISFDLFPVLEPLDFSYIHIIRRNLLRRYISEVRAKFTGIWHSDAQSGMPGRPWINPEWAADNVSWRQEQITETQNLLRDTRHITLHYEDMFDFSTGNFSEDLITELSTFMGIDGLSVDTGLRKLNTGSLGGLIANPCPELKEMDRDYFEKDK